MKDYDLKFVRIVARERGLDAQQEESLVTMARSIYDGAVGCKADGGGDALDFVRMVLDGPFEDEPGVARRTADEIASEVGREIGCREGCVACCDYHVSALAGEVDRIAARVLTMPEEQRRQIVARIQEAMDLGIPQLFDNERLAKRFACPLLIDKRCSVYEERPISCRSWFGFSSKECGSLTESSPFGMLSLIGDVSTYATWLIDSKDRALGGDLIILLAERLGVKSRQARVGAKVMF